MVSSRVQQMLRATLIAMLCLALQPVSGLAVPPRLAADTDPPLVLDDAASQYVASATIHITAEDAASLVTTITYQLDTETTVTVAGPEATVTTSVLGSHTLTYRAADAAGNTSADVTVEFSVLEKLPTTYLGVGGANRYSTAILASQQGFPAGADAVVIASGENWPDALSASALSGAAGGPLLLVPRDDIPPDVMVEINRLGAAKAYVVGGTGAVSAAAFDELRARLGLGAVERLAGADRYGTAQAVAWRVTELMGTSYDGTALVASGGSFADSLSAASLAAANGWPILLSAGTGTLYPNDRVERVVIIGGTGAVAPEVESALEAFLGDANVSRVAGSDRYRTSGMVAEYAAASGLSWNRVGVATGDSYPDGLTGGAVLGQLGGVLVLTPTATLDSAVAAVLQANYLRIGTVYFLGGTAALSTSVREQVKSIVR